MGCVVGGGVGCVENQFVDCELSGLLGAAEWDCQCQR